MGFSSRPTRNPAPFGRSELRVICSNSVDTYHGRLWDFNEKGMCLQLRGSVLVVVGSVYQVKIVDAIVPAHDSFDAIVRWSRIGSVSTYVGVEFSSSSEVKPFLEKFSPPDPWLSVNQKFDRSV